MPSTMVEGMLSLKSLINPKPKPPQVKPSSHELISDTLLDELDFQMKELIENVKLSRKEENDQMGRPDYSWLMNTPKTYRIPQVTRLEIEEISKLIHVDSVSDILNDFRELITSDTVPEQLPTYLKFALHQYVTPNAKVSNHTLVSSKRGNYKLHCGLYEEANHRSNSAIDIQDKLFLGNDRPNSAPLTLHWKLAKRSRVYPIENNFHKKDICVVELEQTGKLSQQKDLDLNKKANSFV